MTKTKNRYRQRHYRFWKIFCISLSAIVILLFAGSVWLYSRFPAKYREQIENHYADWRYILAIVKAESDFDPKAISRTGACGLMQIMPQTATFVAEREKIEDFDLFRESDNLLIGCKYLLYLESKFSDKKVALAAYNAGEGNVERWLNDARYSSDGTTLFKVPFPETENYLIKVKKYYRIYRKIYLTKE